MALSVDRDGLVPLLHAGQSTLATKTHDPDLYRLEVGIIDRLWFCRSVRQMAQPGSDPPVDQHQCGE